MKNQDFKVSIKTVWGLAIGNLIFSFVGVFAKMQHWVFSELLFSIYNEKSNFFYAYFT